MTTPRRGVVVAFAAARAIVVALASSACAVVPVAPSHAPAGLDAPAPVRFAAVVVEGPYDAEDAAAIGAFTASTLQAAGGGDGPPVTTRATFSAVAGVVETVDVSFATTLPDGDVVRTRHALDAGSARDAGVGELLRRWGLTAAIGAVAMVGVIAAPAAATAATTNDPGLSTAVGAAVALPVVRVGGALVAAVAYVERRGDARAWSDAYALLVVDNARAVARRATASPVSPVSPPSSPAPPPLPTFAPLPKAPPLDAAPPTP